MPFGLHFKSLFVGVLLAYFVLPWIMALTARSTRKEA